MPIISVFPDKDKPLYQIVQQAGFSGSEAEFYAALALLSQGPFLPTSGGELSGAVSFSKNGRISGIQTVSEANDAANKDYVDQRNPKTTTVTLSSSGWSGNTQTVSVPGIVTDRTKQIVNIGIEQKASGKAWGKFGVWCEPVSTADSLTFSCDKVPTENIVLNISVQEVGK